MIKLIQADDRSPFDDYLLADMFQNRAEVFGDRLGWDVVVKNGQERDRFDDANPLYLVSVDEAGAYQGSLRLLPTTGPNMLRDVFPQLIGGPSPYDGDVTTIESATIWESSRICTRPGCDQRAVFVELLLGIGEVALLAGLTQIVSVFDAVILRVLRAVGAEPDIIGTPQRIGKAMSYAGLFDVLDLLNTFRCSNGGRSVLAKEQSIYSHFLSSQPQE